MIKKRAFTLIELLVVISIIALLLSILMPGLQRAKEAARDVVCRSNLKQWGLTWAIYTSDNKGKFPMTHPAQGNARGDWILPMRFVWDTYGDIVRCPSASKYIDFGIDDSPHGSYNSTYYIGQPDASGNVEECSYGMNVWAYSGPPDIANYPKEKYWQTINIRSGASSVPLFMDSMWRGGLPDYANGDAITMPALESEHNDWPTYRVKGGIRQFAMPRHGGTAKAGTNVLFFDLTARHINIKELWTLKWHKNFNTAGYETVTGSRFPGWMDKYK